MKVGAVLKRAALLALALVTAGCGSVERARGPAPVERHLVYEKIIGEKGIWIADADGSNARMLAPRGHTPAISPDGKWVTYSGECTESNTSSCDTLYIVSTSGGDKPRRLSTVVSGTVTWSPDSQRIVGESLGKLWSIEVADGKASEVAKGKFWGWSISPDGMQVVFGRLEDPHAEQVLGSEVNLFVAGIGGGDAKRITDTGDAAEPVWGPSAIAYAKLISCLPPTSKEALAGCKNNTWGRHEIWQIQPDGSGRRTITGPLPGRLQGQGFTGLVPRDWSDDGQALLGGWANEWGYVPMAVDPVSGKARELDEAQGTDPVALSGDGRLALIDGGAGTETAPEDRLVLIYPYAGGKPKIVARGAVSPSWNLEQAGATEPVERHLVYEKLIGEKGIWIADVDGGHARLLVPGQRPVISPNGKWVAYSGECSQVDAPSCDKSYVVSTEIGAKPRQIAAQDLSPEAWSPDSKAIVVTRSLGVSKDALVRIDVESGEEVTLAQGTFWGWSLSPDGRRVVLALAHGQDPKNDVFPIIDLYVTDVDGRGDPKPITDTGDSAYPVWGPKAIAFAKLIPVKWPSPNTEFARNEIWRIQPDGTGRRTISGPLPVRFVKGYWHCTGLEPSDWSDDGSTLLAEVGCEAVGQSVAVDRQTGAIRSLGEGTFTVSLSHDARHALVQWGDERAGAENERVLIYPYVGGKPKVVARGAFAPSWNR